MGNFREILCYYVRPMSSLERAHVVFAHVPDFFFSSLFYFFFICFFVTVTAQRLLLRSRHPAPPGGRFDFFSNQFSRFDIAKTVNCSGSKF